MNSQDFYNLQEAYLSVYDNELGEEQSPIPRGTPMNKRWPYISNKDPEFQTALDRVNKKKSKKTGVSEDYMDEGAAGDVAARAEKLAAQRKGQTPERKQMYASLAYKASERERGPRNTDWQRQGLTQKQRNSRREIDVEYSDETGLKNSTDGPGTITKNKRKLAQQKARGQHAEQYMDEAQVANRDPDRYEAGQQKKSAPVRGEKTPMPPRGDKRREDFEKWYAANGPK